MPKLSQIEKAIAQLQGERAVLDLAIERLQRQLRMAPKKQKAPEMRPPLIASGRLSDALQGRTPEKAS